MTQRAASLPIEIATLCLSERTTNIFEMFFNGPCSGRFRLAAQDKAQMAIIDLDAIDSETTLKKYKSDFPDNPVLAISVKDRELEGVKLLQKPITLKALEQGIFKLQECVRKAYESVPRQSFEHALSEPVSQNGSELDPGQSLDAETEPLPILDSDVSFFDGEQDITDESLSQSTPKVKSSGIRLATIAFENQKKMLHECCGSIPDIPIEELEGSNQLYYRPERYLQRTVEQAIARAVKAGKVARLDIPDQDKIFVLPLSRCIVTTMNDRVLRRRTFLEGGTGDITLRLTQDEEEQLKRDNSVITPFDSFLWKLALWSARGRLPAGSDLHQALRLHRWPNLTRLMGVPQFLRIAAYWTETSDSLLHTVDILSIEQRVVFSFYSACLALGLIDQTAEAIEPRQEPHENHNPQRQRHSYMGRLLTHLRRGEEV